MDDDLRLRLAALPTLSTANRTNLICKICGGVADIFDVVDLQKACSWPIYQFGLSGIPVYYYKCMDCNFVFTTFIDNWTNDEIGTYIYNDDYIKVDPEYRGERAVRDAQLFTEMLAPYKKLAILDYGSGNGVLAASLREHGFDAESYDPFSSPARPDRQFDFISCMEVIEHSPDPLATMREMASLLKQGGCIFVGTQLQPDNIDAERTHWWYVAPRNGHVSLQSKTSIVTLGSAAGLTCYPSSNLHGFTTKPSSASVDLLKQVGRPTLNLLLAAPGELASGKGSLRANETEWHHVEDGSFRWTASDAVTWHWTPAVGDCDVNIRIPVVMDIQPTFLANSRLLIEDQVVATRIERQDLIASASVTGAGPVTFRFETPPLRTPYDLRGFPDMRHLGVAVRVAK